MSTTDKKKSSTSPKYSIKEHHDEKTDNNNREKKNNIDEIPIEEIHTANDWEHADLGDEQRKQKFLRLMGVKKRKDESGISIKDSHNTDEISSERKHSRSSIENETISRELEKQFNESLQSNILHTHHEGLGFHSDEPSTSTTASTSDDWHHQQVQTRFVPATTEMNSSSLK